MIFYTVLVDAVCDQDYAEVSSVSNFWGKSLAFFRIILKGLLNDFEM